ncbi:MAG: S8 family serine peptidase [Actinobacteria bacterium]|nr:S8 family serine peptidase [Actinomycetota bacterium]
MRTTKTIIALGAILFIASLSHACEVPRAREEPYPHGLSLSMPPYVPGELLVKFRAGTPEERRSYLLELCGAGRVLKEMGPPQGRVLLVGLNPGVTVESAAGDLVSFPEVEYAEPNYTNYFSPAADHVPGEGLEKLVGIPSLLPLVPNDSYFNLQWGLHNTGQTIGGVAGVPGADIGAAAAWEIERGYSHPVTVAVLDSGIKFDHPDLDGKIWTNEDEIPDNGVDDDANGYVDDVHGYNFAGISQTLFFSKSGGSYIPQYRQFGTGTGTQMYAQSIKGTGYDITHVGILLLKVGNPTGEITVSVRSDLNGPDLGTFTICPDDEPERRLVDTLNLHYRELSSPYHLAAGATCYLVFRTTNLSSSDFYYIFQGRNPYPEGQQWLWNGSAWSGSSTYDFYFKTNPNPHPRDDFGHGTSVSGVVAAESDNARGISGVSHGAMIMPLKVLSAAGYDAGAFDIAELVEGIYYAADNGAKVASMSLGSPFYSQAVQDAVDYAHAKGMVLCAAVGNDGADYVIYPACLDNVIGCAATTNQDQWASFSNHHARVDASAPGRDIYVTKYEGSGGYAFGSGTSYATPHVAGLAALVFSLRPGYTPEQVELAIFENAKDLGEPGRDDYFGHGRIDAYATLLSVSHDGTIFTVSASAGPGGSIDPEGMLEAVAASDLSLTITPAPGHRIAGITDNGVAQPVTDAGGMVYTLTGVQKDHDIRVTFELTEYDISCDVEPAGSGGVWGTGTYKHGSRVTLTALPAAGFRFVRWKEEGREVSTANPYVFDAERDRTLSAEFSEAARTWYLAEGCTAGGFETWVVVQNPGEEAVTVDLVLQTAEGERRPAGLQGQVIPAASRRSFRLNDHLVAWEVSTRVEASGPVVCERAVYGAGRTWAHDSLGASEASRTWYLAEGCTAGGFETWVVVQNPGEEAVTVDLVLQTAEGERRPAGLQGQVIPAASRRSFRLNDHLVAWEVSTRVEASGPVVCERAVYGAGRTWAHDSLGSSIIP